MPGIAEAFAEDPSVLQPGPALTVTSSMPTTVRAVVGNRVIELPPDQAQKALAAGAIKLPANVPLHVRGADGSYSIVQPNEVNQALADGGALASARDHHQADLDVKLKSLDTGVGSGILATAAGGLRGLTSGLSDAVLADQSKYSGDGPSDLQQEVSRLKTSRPILSGIGEVGGMLGQAALAPELDIAGLASKGVAAVGGEGLAGRVASTAARAAIENVQLAHTDMVSEEALGGPDVTAEKYFATIGKQALFGAAAGAVGELALGGLKAARGALFKPTAAADLDGVAEKTFGYAPKGGGVGDALVKAQAFLAGADSEGTSAIQNAGVQNLSAGARALRATALNIDEVRSDAVKSLSADMDNLLKKTEGIADESRGISKREHLKGLVESPLPAPEVQAHAMDSLQDVRNQVSAMASDADTFGNGGALKRIDQQLRAHEKDLVDAVEKGDQAEMFAVLDDTKRTIGGWSRKFSSAARAGDPLAREQAQEVFTKLGDVERGGGIYEQLRKNLEDETTWGKAAIAQKGINAAWTDYIAASKQMGRAASVTSQVGENNFGRAVYGVDPAKMERYVAGLVNPNNDLAHKAMADYIASSKALAHAIDDGFVLSPEKQAMVTAVKASAAQMQLGLADIGDKLAKVNQIKALMDAGSGPGAVGAGLIGHVVGGPIGGMLGAAMGSMASPGKNIMRLAQLEGVVAKFDGKAGGALSRFFGRARAAGAGAGEAGAGRAAGKVAVRAAKEAAAGHHVSELRIDKDGMRPESMDMVRAQRDSADASEQRRAARPVVIEHHPGEPKPIVTDGRHRIAVAKERGDQEISSIVRRYDAEGNVLSEVKQPLRLGEASTREEFEHNSKSVLALQDPTVLTGKLAPHFEALQGSAPQTARGLGASASAAVAYLATKLPTAPPADPLTGKPGQPSASEMALYNVRVRAVNDPTGVVDDLARGRITTEQVETLQAVYPGIYRELQAKAQQSLLEHAQAGHPLPFQQRVALGVLLGIDSDPSLAKPAMGHAMATFGKPPAPPPKGGGGGSSGPSVMAKEISTPEQRMSQGGV